MTNFFASAVRDDESKEIILKVVNANGQPVPAAIQRNGSLPDAQRAQATILTSDNTAGENSFEQPRKVAPATISMGDVGAMFDYTFKPNSLTVLRIGPGSQ